MQWVDLNEFDSQTKRAKTRVRFVLDGGSIRWEGDEATAKRIAADGVFSPSAGRGVLPADGELFLHGLVEEFRAPQFSASDVQEGTTPPPIS